MAKKNQKQSENNLLSERMKKTEHGKKNGRYAQQAEINIFVQEENTQPAQQFDNDIRQNTRSHGYQQPIQPTYDDNVSFENPQNQHNSVGNSFSDRLRKQQQTSEMPNSNVQEFTFNADDENDEMRIDPNAPPVFDDRYSDMYRNRKPRKEPRQKPTPEIGENALDGSNGNPFKKTIPKKIKLAIIFTIIGLVLIIPQLVFRIPALIDIGDRTTLKTVDSSEALTDYIKVQQGVADFDKDGVLNASDTAVFDPDENRNGIPDSQPDYTFVNKGDLLTYENITIEAQNQKVGVSKFLNYYVFNNYKGWAKITNETGIPYIYGTNGWTEADYNKENGTYYVKIPKDCYIEFVPEGTVRVYATDLFGEKIFAQKESRYVKDYGIFAPITSVLLHTILPVTEPTDCSLASIWYTDTYHIVKQKNLSKAEAIAPDSTTYDLYSLKTYKFSYDDIYKMYEKIDNKETALISIITKDGKEAIAFAYAYDYLGNIYVADAQTSKTVGMIKIIPKSQVYYENGSKYMREWYEFEGVGFSSTNGDVLVIF